MGDRYILDLKCSYCQTLNEEVYFAPTCNFFTFNCKNCKKTNFINSDFVAIKIKDVKYKDVLGVVEMATNFMDEKQTESFAKDFCELPTIKMVGFKREYEGNSSLGKS